MVLQVKNYMTTTLHSISPDDTISTAKARMSQLGVRHLPVIAADRLVGVISSRDLFLLDALKDRMVQLIKVSDLMSEKPYAVSPQTPISEVAMGMAELRIGSAVVLEGTRVVGLFTTTDALRALSDLTRGG